MLNRLTFDRTSFGIIGIRPHKMSDANALIQSANTPEVVKYALDSFPHPYTDDDAEEYLQSIVEQTPRPHFAITANDKLIGGLGFMIGEDVEKYSAIITYWLGKDYWGDGIATMLVSGVCDFAFKQTDITRLSARVFEGNIASEMVLEKCGFEKEGILRKSIFKHNKFIDGILYAKIKE